jgi:hypothetical protein
MDEGARRHAVTVADVPYPQLHEIAGAELAVDGQVEKGEISTATCDLESYANRPYLLKFEGGFLAYELSFVPRLTSGRESAGVHDRLLLVGAFSLLFPVSWRIYLEMVVRRS